MGKSLLTREEITLIQNKYLPTINREYRDVVRFISLVAEKQAELEGDELYLSDNDQTRLLRKVGLNVLELENAVKNLKQYLIVIKNRLDL